MKPARRYCRPGRTRHWIAGDVDGDGSAEIICAAGPGGGPAVAVYRIANGSARLEGSFFAFDPSFTGGLFIAAGDVAGVGRDYVVAGADAGGGICTIKHVIFGRCRCCRVRVSRAEMKKLEGTWIGVSAIVDGKKVPDDAAKSLIFTLARQLPARAVAAANTYRT